VNVLLHDFRYALRMLLRSPGSTAAAVLALALGIGANSAVFSLADILLFRPIDLKDLDRLVMIRATDDGRPESRLQVPPADFLQWRTEARSFEQLAAASGRVANLTGAGAPQRVQGYQVSANFFQALGVGAGLGRVFLPQEEPPGSDRVAVLSFGLWRRQFGSDPGVIGRQIYLHGQAHRVVGVMPQEFRFPRDSELWIPLAITAQMGQEREGSGLSLVGRLRPNSRVEEAQAEMQVLADRLRRTFPESHATRGVRVESLLDSMTRGGNRDYSLMCLIVVGFVLLIACVNVANLQIARISGRAHELAIRTAVGASRWRLIRQVIAESLLLAGIGGLVGILLGSWGVDLLRRGAPPEAAMNLPRWDQFGLNGLVLAYTGAVAILAGVVSGITPAFFATRSGVSEVLMQGGRRVSSGLGRSRLRNLLVAGQLTLSMTLLAGAGLMVKGFRTLILESESLQPSNVLTFRLALPETRYTSSQAESVLGGELLRRVSRVGGLQTAALVTQIPHSSFGSTQAFRIEGRAREQEAEDVALIQSVSPGYFQIMQIPLREGRLFDSRDEWGRSGTAIVSESLAKRYFGESSPLGRRVRAGGDKLQGPFLTIVGVVGDIRHHWTEKSPRPALYVSFAQAGASEFGMVARTSGGLAGTVSAIRAEIAAVDPELPMFAVLTLDEVITRAMSSLQLVVVLMGISGALALVLATVGVYSVTAYIVSERTHEMGIRLALGARPQDVVWMMVRRGLTLIVAGMGVGVVAAYLLARMLSSLIFGTSPGDLGALAGIPLLLALSAALASWLPARKVGRIDPERALRYE
jgi:putative ABC transport system permease protein